LRKYIKDVLGNILSLVIAKLVLLIGVVSERVCRFSGEEWLAVGTRNMEILYPDNF